MMGTKTKIRIRLRRVNLSKAKEHKCSGIKPGKKEYLCLIDGKFWAGSFSREWYGLYFDGWEDIGLQFDAPGSNSSGWQAVWEIQKQKCFPR
jgi:hypothetical protein